MHSLARRLTIEHCRTSGRVTFRLDNVFWVECDVDQEARVRRMLFGRGGLADEVTLAPADAAQ